MTDKVMGPICEKCEKPAKIIVPILEMRETFMGHKEMIKMHLCLYHFMELMEEAPLEEPKPDDEEEEEKEDEEEDEEWNKRN